jgi:hypothetical protein
MTLVREICVDAVVGRAAAPGMIAIGVRESPIARGATPVG